MKLLLFTLLASCSIPHEHTLKPSRKFVDGEVRHGRLVIQTAPASGVPPEIILFQDGRGNEFTIYER